LKAVHRIEASKHETILAGAFNTGFGTVSLHGPTTFIATGFSNTAVPDPELPDVE